MNTSSRITPALLATGLAIISLLAWRGMMRAEDARIVAIVFASIVLWATGAVAGLLVSLLFFLLAATLTSVPAAEIFSGFASSAFWLVFSGSAIGFALKESGLSERIGMALARSIGGSYLRALLAFAVLSFLLSLVMPSTFGRVAILIPIAIGYCDVVKLGESANGRRGILLLVIVGSYELAAAVLPANLPNVILAGILEQSHGIHLRFSEYLLYFFPAGVVVRGAVLIFASYWLFADTVHAVSVSTDRVAVSKRELHTVALLTITLAFWFTDSIHHIAPGWVGLGFTLAYFLTSPPEQLTRFTATLKMDLLWFIAAIIGVTALVNHLEIRIPDTLALESLRDSPFFAYLALTALSIVLCFAVTSNAEPALFVPVVSRVLAQSAHLKAGLLMQVMGYATTFMPYQSPPVVFGNELARLDRRAALKYCIVTALLGLAFVLPVNAIWWRLLGLL
ncbi:sodium:sulfate symporter [bacterium M00.F.Ca.ET.228.01.1.1]|uniref:SLC13 family permease n=1 Tax=Paraburkholderia phenoliruptrix TaxID=252970 RepID=UPI001092741B|nr:SLC13 family permease [Paraburkholderia phenoliruptrix]TGP47530.1 sodium:sulfate symporter [bacterium M00.F.Ca.ET.228.01.1.1]TGS05323.1 sodium:sulfate symporter [bacterium M00.F.Ca.ET.191.01.1.1]TGU10259.1 sodium:sulfate symporter [bacterium M00.F.Ca.ET.155.01.1.1]MBW0445689.1 anion permease [Paraburkholderia phenoliruptrix]MBW9096454.1 anion permease [Paraburkholderia phenoliruptrix]